MLHALIDHAEEATIPELSGRIEKAKRMTFSANADAGKPS